MYVLPQNRIKSTLWLSGVRDNVMTSLCGYEYERVHDNIHFCKAGKARIWAGITLHSSIFFMRGWKILNDPHFIEYIPTVYP